MINADVKRFWSMDFIDLLKETSSVVQFSYRTAQVEKVLFSIERDSEAEKVLAEKAGKSSDNHTVYKVEFDNGAKLFIGCSDSEMTFGLGYRPLIVRHGH